MTTPTLFKEYIWLVNTIYQAGNITFSDINKKWLKTEMSGGVELARSTFNRHKVAIEDIFGIRIECDRSNGYTYYIGNAEVLGNESVNEVINLFHVRIVHHHVLNHLFWILLKLSQHLHHVWLVSLQ